MALSSQASFAPFHCSVSQNRTTKFGKSNLKNNLDLTVSPMLTPQKWSITHDNTLLIPSTTTTPMETYTSTPSYPCNTDLDLLKNIIRKAGEDPSEGLMMVDAIQRLGIDYIFEDEIEDILQNHLLMFFNDFEHSHDHDQQLHEIALRFRLLRQQGHFVPADIFNNFKDNKGLFMTKINEDINGLMGLFEASHLRIDGEHVLDEAEQFSGHLLNASMTRLNHHQARVVANTLENPCHKSLAKFTAKNLIGRTSPTVNNGYINVLQQLAKVEFNKVQSIHKREIVQISKWWEDIGLAKELAFARDQPLKWYLWSMACLTDPSLSQHRVELTKPISFIYIIDDIFDVYGSLDELILFTEAVNSWESNAIEKLPDYMKICFKALDNLTNEISHKVYKKHGLNPLHSLRKTWASLCNAFLVEAKWFASGHVPKAEEYLKNGVVSSGVHVVLVHILFLLGQGITQDTVDFVDSMPGIITSTAAILRLWDDLGSAKDENQEGHDGSYMECYMKEREGSSIEDAREQIIQKISDAWKRLNKECLSPNSLPPKFVKASINLARLVPLMYSYDDNQRLPSLEEHMKSMLYESVAM